MSDFRSGSYDDEQYDLYASGHLMSSSKRPFRPRRKEPSCDTCRERKVKCDANGSKACTECQARNVRCQFTKEHNKRMSSLKVVQDLERQLRDTRNDLYDAQTTIDNLRAQLHIVKTTGKSVGDDGHPDLYVTSFDSLKARQALSETSPSSTPAAQSLNPFHDYSPLRRQIIRLSDGIFKAPPGWGLLTKATAAREATFLQLIKLEHPIRLPDRNFAEQILDVFRESVEKFMYIMNWPEFETNVDKLYKDSVDGTIPPGARLSFVRFFFGLLGFTMIFSQDDRICKDRERGYAGHEFIAVAYQMPLTTTHFHLDDVRAGLQVIFWLKSAHFLELAHVWSGATVKIAQELGLHQELEGLPSIIRDERRRVWWYVYAFDRVLASESYGEMVIYDADTNVPFPFGDKRIDLIKQGHTSGMMAKDPWTTTLFSWLRDVAKITRGLRELPYLETHDIERMVARAQTQWASYPLETVLDADDPTSSPFLTNYMLLQDSMLTINRHNLSPMAPMTLRIQALKHCIDTCRTWSVLTKRCAFDGQNLTKEQTARTHRFITLVLPEFCLHLWRCELLLFASGMYHDAISLVIASKAIGDYRPVNLELPKYAAGLLNFCHGKGSIYDHATTGQWTIVDEEILAFAVGDMHGMYRGRGFPDLWDRPSPRARPRTSESESDGGESVTSETVPSAWYDREVKCDDMDEGDVTWDDVLDLVRTRAKEAEMTKVDGSPSRPQAVPNRMSIQNLI